MVTTVSLRMSFTSTESDPSNTATPTTTPKLSSYALYYIIAGASAFLVLVIIIIIIIIIVCCRRRRRQRKKYRPHLPDPTDPGLNQESNHDHSQHTIYDGDVQLQTDGIPFNMDYDRHSLPGSNHARDLPAIPIVAVDDSYYENAPNRHRRGESSDDEDGDSKHDYENNPVERQMYAEEVQHHRKESPRPFVPMPSPNPRKSPKIQLSQSQTLRPDIFTTQSPVEKSTSFQQKHSPNLSNSHGPRGQGHATLKGGYVNTSISLENLDKRVVPLPPPLPSDLSPVTSFNKRVVKSSPVPLPKPHSGKIPGYVNQPA